MRVTKVGATLPSYTVHRRYSGLRGLHRCVVFDEWSILALRLSLTWRITQPHPSCYPDVENYSHVRRWENHQRQGPVSKPSTRRDKKFFQRGRVEDPALRLFGKPKFMCAWFASHRAEDVIKWPFVCPVEVFGGVDGAAGEAKGSEWKAVLGLVAVEVKLVLGIALM